jgi:glycosyltransferase involved in cell wall biosynthesis
LSQQSLVVSLPVHRPPATLSWTVRSLLRQSHRDVRVILVADGRVEDLYGADSIKDSRIVRFATERNGGPYWVHEIVRRATDEPFFSIHDADDFSLPGRLSELVGAAALHGAAFTPQWVLSRSRRPITTRAVKFMDEPPSTLKYQAHHSGVFSRERLDRVGYLASARVGFDALFVSLMSLTGPVWASRRRSYVRVMRSTGLTSDPSTGRASELRRSSQTLFSAIYLDALDRWRAGERDFADLVRSASDPETEALVATEVSRLRRLL